MRDSEAAICDYGTTTRSYARSRTALASSLSLLTIVGLYPAFWSTGSTDSVVSVRDNCDVGLA